MLSIDTAQYTAGAVHVAQRASKGPAAARCAVERSDEYLCTGGAYRRHIVK